MFPNIRELNRLRDRECQLLEANNRELERRRSAERDAAAVRIAMENMLAGNATQVLDLRHALAGVETANKELRAKVDRLERSVLNQAGDNLCFINALKALRDGIDTQEMHCEPVPVCSSWRYIIDFALKSQK